MEQKHFTNLIEAYLDKSISPEGQKELTELLHSSKEYQKEFDLQNNIIKQIQNSRRLELKSRLADIPVSADPWFLKPAFQYAASVALSLSMAAGAYILFDKNPEPTDEINMTVELDHTILSKTNNQEIPNIPTVHSLSVTPKYHSKAGVSSNDISVNNPLPKEPKIETENKALIIGSPHINRPIVADDNPLGMDELTNESNLDMPEITFASTPKNTTKRLDINLNKETKFDFHYRFIDENLFLFGDFTSSPYEIIEVPSDKGMNHFLYWEGAYYSLAHNVEIPTALEQIKDDSILQELDIIRSLK